MLTVGEILRSEREKKGISLADVEKRIRVREKYLEAIEENNWKNFPSKIYIIGVIKNYSKYLGLDREKMLAFFRRDYEKGEDVRFKERLSRRYFTSQARNIAYIGIVAVFLFFFSYFGYQLIQYFVPPGIEIIAPKTNRFVKEDRVKIIAKTSKDATVNIFGERIFQSRQGIFEYDLPLKVGKNELVIEITGASGKKRIIKKEFFREK